MINVGRTERRRTGPLVCVLLGVVGRELIWQDGRLLRLFQYVFRRLLMTVYFERASVRVNLPKEDPIRRSQVVSNCAVDR